jgi:glycosyltransferase involved in cell wall biosynthesis
MKILLVSYFFPPYNSIGAVRVGKFAKFLNSFGHDTKVITARGQYWDELLTKGLSLEIDPTQVTYTPWLDLSRAGRSTIHFFRRTMIRDSRTGKCTSEGFGNSSSILRGISTIYRSVFCFPDSNIGWMPFAYSAGKKLIKSWKPDIIVASALPPTSFLIAKKLAKQAKVPWVADLRDLWVDNHFYEYPSYRRRLEAKLEQHVLSTAQGIVTVTEPFAATLRQKYAAPVRVITNGFDPTDFPTESKPWSRSLPLKITYTGNLYAGKRDPSDLFQAIRQLGPQSEKVQVNFFGPRLGWVSDLAAAYGLSDIVVVNGPVDHREALEHQVESHLLFLPLSVKERGVYPAKLFEYIGAGRLILSTGTKDAIAGALINQHSLGFNASDPHEMSRFLNEQIISIEAGRPQLPPHEAKEQFMREVQARQLEQFLEEITHFPYAY